MRTHFLHPGLGRSRLSDVLEGEWAWGLIICLLHGLKNIGEVDEAMFQGVERPYEHIF
jgi:hypothetical protein